MSGLRLILDNAFTAPDLEYVIEEKNLTSPGAMYIRGPYILVNERNKNGRIYDSDEMRLEIARYTKEMIKEDRALGELNHPASAEVNLERACHKIIELTENGNHYIGKSKILSTPMGILTKTLILDQVKIGVSTRCLGKLISEGMDTNRVHNARLVAVDCVADPSAPKAFLNGVLEARQFILEANGNLREVYEELDDALSTLPKHDIDKYLLEQISTFIRKISN
jgi:hypothetical protein